MQVLLARGLALVWVGFWMFFFVVESWVWQTTRAGALAWAGLGLVFVALALTPWRWERLGGLLLGIGGLLSGMAYAIWSPPRLPASSRVLTTLVFSGPPIVAGVLFLRHGRAHQDAA